MNSLFGFLRDGNAVYQTLRRGARPLFFAAGLYRLLSLLLLTPLVSAMFGLLLAGSGRTVLSNEEIAAFFLRPLGIAGLVALAAASITIVALEQACLIVIAREALHSPVHRALPALVFALRRAALVLQLALRVVLQILLRTAPFAAAAAVVYLLLLTENDINFYLDRRPPEFHLALSAVGLLGLGLTAVLLRYSLRVLFSLPILLFEDGSPQEALLDSARRTRGHRVRMAAGVVAWALTVLVASTGGTAFIIWLARLLVPGWIENTGLLVFLFGALFLALGLLQLLLSIGASAAFALLVELWYEELSDRRWGSDNSRPWKPEVSGTAVRTRKTVTAGAAAVVILVGAAGAALSGWFLLSSTPSEVRTEIVAHRGASGAAPENTMAAVDRAIADGADWVEIDVQRTADDHVVVIHDRDLMRIGGVPLVVGETRYAEIAAVDVGSWFDPAFAQERIPLLSAALERCRGRMGLIIELKYYGWDEKLASLVVEAVEQAGMVPHVRIMSLQPDGIRQVRKLRPEWPVGLLSAAALGDLTRMETDFLAVHSRMATPGFVQRVQAAGQALHVWTVNDGAGIVQFLGMGVDGIITDEPLLADRLRDPYRRLKPIHRLMVNTGLLVAEDAVHVDPGTDAKPLGETH